MQQNTPQISRPASLRNLLLLLLLLVLLVPLLLSNNPKGAALGTLSFAFLFFPSGYLLLSMVSHLRDDLGIFLSLIFGIACITTAYSFFAQTSVVAYFLYFVMALSAGGIALVLLQARKRPRKLWWTQKDWGTVVAGIAVALSIAPLYWRSGRFSHGEFVLYGPAAKDPLFHVTLLQRLLYHVPPDNFIVSGLRAPVYHYFDDLTLAFVLRAQSILHFAVTDLFDVYYRCYPILVYSLLGALAYRAGRQLLGSVRGGILSILLLLGGGGLGWFLGVLQTASHVSQLSVMRSWFFSPWTSWDGVDAILPLVHRPAHYHGLLISLAAFNVLLRPDRSRRDWILAGLLLGLMAGFNFTLAATFGLAAVLGSLLLLLQRKHGEARDLAWLAGSIFLSSLPVTLTMLFSGFHNPAPGFPFRGPNLEFSTAMWRPLLDRIMPQALVPLVSLIVFPIFAYGMKLFGLRAMVRLDLGEDRHRSTATVFSLVFALSFLIGTLFPYQALGGIGIVFIQPTLWILGLFALRPLNSWLGLNGTSWRPIAVWSILVLTWMQAILAFHFAHQASFDQASMQVLENVHAASAPDDVVAYLPSNLKHRAVLGAASESTNFAITAITGLDGYFSTQSYSIPFAVPGLSGQNSADVLGQAERLYKQRSEDIGAFVKGNITDVARARLIKDHVRWIVVSGEALQQLQTSEKQWQSTPEIAVYRISP